MAITKRSGQIQRSTAVLLFVLGLAGTPAAADSISMFSIRSVADPTQPGGLFSDGGSFYGTFAIDESAVAQGPASGAFTKAVVSWDVTTTAGGPMPGVHYSSSDPLSNSFLDELSQVSLDITNLFGEEVTLIEQGVPELEILRLYFMEPTTEFAGGVIFEAAETAGGGGRLAVPSSAMVVDPAVISQAPETESIWMLGFGSLFLGVRHYLGRHRSRG